MEKELTEMLVDLQETLNGYLGEANDAKDRIAAARKDLDTARFNAEVLGEDVRELANALYKLSDSAYCVSERMQNALDDWEYMPEEKGFEDFAGRCSMCGEELTENDMMIADNGDLYCEECYDETFGEDDVDEGDDDVAEDDEDEEDTDDGVEALFDKE